MKAGLQVGLLLLLVAVSAALRPLLPQPVRPQPIRIPSIMMRTPVYIRNVPFIATVDDVKHVLTQRFGTVTDMKLDAGPKGAGPNAHAGRGRVVFEDDAAARAALLASYFELNDRRVALAASNHRDKRSRGAKAKPMRRTAAREVIGQQSRSRTLHLLSNGRLTQSAVASHVETLSRLRSSRELTTVITALCRVGSYPAALAALEKAQRYGSFQPSLINFNAALSACERAGAWRRAAQLLEYDMAEASVPPDQISYHTAIAACVRSEKRFDIVGHRPGAVRRGRPMLKRDGAATSSQDRSRTQAARCAVRLICRMMRDRRGGGEGLIPHKVAWTNAMVVCTRSGLWKVALALHSRLERLQPEAIDVVASNAALAACAGLRDGARALQVLNTMTERYDLEPDVASFDAAMEALSTSGDLDAGFELLERVHRTDDPELLKASYPIHRTLLLACAAAGDFDRAETLQATMNELNIKSIRPVAVVPRPSGTGKPYYNGGEGKLGEASRKLCALLERQGGYAPRVEALPFGMRRNSTRAQQVNSLRHHAEKKAIADMLLRGADELELSINTRVCLDCHEFLKASSLVLGKPVIVNEPHMRHVFENGACSCGDAWRWEVRGRVVPRKA